MPEQSSCKHWLSPEHLAGFKHTQWHAFSIILSWYTYMNTRTTDFWNLVQVSKKRHMLIFAHGFLVHRFIRKWVSKYVFLPSQRVTFGPSFSKTRICNLSQGKSKSSSFKDKVEVLEIHLFLAHLLIYYIILYYIILYYITLHYITLHYITLYYIILKHITSPGWMHETGARAWFTGKTQRNRVEREVGGRSGREIHVTPWLIHVCVWQKTLQYCIIISLHLIKINGEKSLLSFLM